VSMQEGKMEEDSQETHQHDTHKTLMGACRIGMECFFIQSSPTGEARRYGMDGMM
jgi:hypothetical protein